MRILAIVIGLIGVLVLLYSMSIPAIFAGSYFIGGIILMLAAIGLFIYGSKEAEKKEARKEAEVAAYAASPEGKAAAQKGHSVLASERVWAAPRDDLLKEPPPPRVGENRAPAYWMIGGGIVVLIILVATLG
tara:strand:+ start:413 stop:808 length:396 start_codon:yes stop_codon:yes gene_type:complete